MQPRRLRDSRAFSIIDVLMATVILVVCMMGMIQAVTIGSEMLATAKRQTLAAQIISHEIEKLRLVGWSTTTTVAGTTYTGGIAALANSPAATYDSDLQAIDDAIAASGVTFSVAREVTIFPTDLREVTFTVTWTKGNINANTAAPTPSGSWLDKLAYYRESPIARTYTRKGSAWFGKYGLNLSYQRS